MNRLENIGKELKIPEVRNGDLKIHLPQVPEGFRLELRGTDKLPVIDTAGNIGTPITDQEVCLYFVLKDKASGLTADITHLKVSIKGEFSLVDSSNPCPQVIPALREWVGGKGKYEFRRNGKILLDPVYEKELRVGGEVLAADFRKLGNWNYTVKSGKPEAGAIYMTLNTVDRQLGEEGYRMTIGDAIKIEAPTRKGAFWATRTLLQMLQQQGTSLAEGIVRDYPKYSRRGFTFDVARKFIRLGFLQDYIRIMSYYKMNEFHVHLNDNGFVQFFDNDWDKTYSAFRLESETFPGLTAKDGHYTKKEFTALQHQGMDYGVNVFPEIDVPAHSLAFSHYRKSLGSTKYGMDHLDLFNPEVYPFLDSLFKEYLEGPEPVFVGPEVHIGTDEYAKEAAEEFRAFTDHYIQFVQSFGKKARLWGALTHAVGKTPVTVDNVIMNAWYNGYADPVEMVKLGYDLISTPDGLLYIVPAAGYYYDYLNTKYLYEKWEPVIVGKQVFPVGHPQILGGSFAVWNDHYGNGITEKDIHHRAFPPMQVLAEKMWTGGRPGDDYERFSKVAETMIEAPGTNLMAKIPSKGELVLQYKLENGMLKDMSGNGYNVKKKQHITTNRTNGIIFSGNSSVILPVSEIGYNYTVQFDICLAQGNMPDAILFKSSNAVVMLDESGRLAFEREGCRYVFDLALIPGEWMKIAIQGDAKGTALYVNDKLIQLLQGKKRVVKDKNGRESSMHIQQTLVFPLKQIGDSSNGFKGMLKNLEVYNKK